MWAKRELRNQPITAVSTALAVAVAAAGFCLTYFQIRDATRALQASNGYAIQRDARELLADLRRESDFVALMSGNTPPDTRKAIEGLWLMVNFYLSVHRQAQVGGLTEQFEAAFASDFCGLVGRPDVKAAWDQMLDAKQIGAEQVAMREDWCGEK